MPGFDGTGPAGRGPMTGGGRGPCSPYVPYRYPAYRRGAPLFGFWRPRWGLGRGLFGRGRGSFGRGRGLFGRGRGWRW